MEESKLSMKQERFCIEFCKDFNAGAAARRSGYSLKTAYNIGWENVRKPEIKDRIAELLKELSMKPEEIKKRLSDIARGDMGDYIIAIPTPHTPRIQVGLEVVISRLRNDMAFEDDYAMQANLSGKELDKHQKEQEYRRRQLIRYKLELERNPKATRIIDGETEMIEVAELDIIALSRDKEKGKIKSFKQTKDGIHVELYPADGALANLAKVYAMFIDKSEVDIKGKLEALTDDQLDELMNQVVAKLENEEQEQ